ncbi:MAG TPA: hypothetical protein VFW02_03195 [Candidatus Limnocylindrales bacterium]|nr:hypothetical protein [Candidatus Limnocylindrales bacterium]
MATTRSHVPYGRRIGALAGAVPAAAVILVLFILGASPGRDAVPWLAGIMIVAVGTGWLIGPRVSGSFPADLWMAVAFALAGTIVYLLVGTAMSVWSGPAIDGDLLPGIAGGVASQLVYGLLYAPFLVGLLTPFGLSWVVAVRALRRMTGVPAPVPRPSVAGGHHIGGEIDPRRMGRFAAVLIVAFGLFVAVLPLLIYHEPRSPWSMYRPVALFVLFSVPAWIGVIGTIRPRPSLLVTAGVICFAQAYVSFSLVTIGFVVPAILLIVVGAGHRSPDATPEPRRAHAASAAVIALTFAAWIATLGMTEEVCWTSTANPDGSLAYQRVPVTDVMTVQPGAAASGCDGGTLTAEGMGVGAALAIGAVAIAAASTWPRRTVLPV